MNAPAAAPAESGVGAFLAWLRERVAACAADGEALAVLFIDYDIVARLDSAQGFAAGDAAHRGLVERMQRQVLRPGDRLVEVARGQMACALSPLPGAGVAQLAANKAMRVLGEPIDIAGSPVRARPAIGIAICPDHGANADALLQRARIACRIAREHAERVAEYAPQHVDPRGAALLLEHQLREAIAAEALELAFQPRIELSTLRVVGTECLLHWPARDRPPATPAEVLATVEATELSSQISAWLLHAALRNGADLLHRGLHLRIGLRLPASCLRASEFPDQVDRALHTWPVQRGQLVIAFAGLATVGARTDTIESLQRLRKLGVRLAMDSLGTGDATLLDLASVQFDEMRIALRQLPEFHRAPRQERILRALIELAHQLGLTAVAEGADDDAAAAQLANLACDHACGRHFGLPLEAAQFGAAYEGRS